MKELRFYLGLAPRNTYKDMVQIVVKQSYLINTSSMYKVSECVDEDLLLSIDNVYGLSCYSDISSITIISSVNTQYRILPLFKYITENTKHTKVRVMHANTDFTYTLTVD